MGQGLASFNIVPTRRGSGSQLGIGVGAGPTCRENRFAGQSHGFSLVPTLFMESEGGAEGGV